MLSRLTLGLLLVSALAPASAFAQTLALVEPEPEWREAVETALSPWGTRVVEASVPGPRAPAGRFGARVAEDSRSDVVVWFARASDFVQSWLSTKRASSSSTTRRQTSLSYGARSRATVIESDR